jgi:hypothetical protein
MSICLSGGFEEILNGKRRRDDVHLVLYVPFLGGLAHPAKDTYTFTA